jgi:hypothetical protein
MAKLKTAAITEAELTEYLDHTSDFAFELRTLKQFKSRGFSCEHGGTYIDPTLGKPREFDIRARRQNEGLHVALSVECKNVRENYPLLVTTVPRAPHEAFHQLIHSTPPRSSTGKYWRTLSVHGPISRYRVGDCVGKHCVQVGRLDQNGSPLSGSDSDMYSRWEQALSSAAELVAEATRRGDVMQEAYVSLVVPVVVVPTGRLWRAEYDSSGNRLRAPEQCDRVSIYAGRTYHADGAGEKVPIALSHFEIVTTEGLPDLMDEVCCRDRGWFPSEAFIEPPPTRIPIDA